MQMKVISFFSGAGGMDLGFVLAGHEIIWSNDFDQYAVETYNNNIGFKNNHKSVLADVVSLLDTSKEEISKILPDGDIIIGGFPCQGFSIANINRSMEDSRNFLYEQLLKAISVKQPKYFLLENVKGLESMEGGKILSMILDDLEVAGTIKSKFFPSEGVGYTVVYGIHNALTFGVPQNRERVIILGIRNDILNQSPLLNHFDDSKANGKYDCRKKLHIKGNYSADAKEVFPMSPVEISNKLYEAFLNDTTFNVPYGDKKYKYRTVKDAISDLPEDFDEKVLNHAGTKCKVKINNSVGNRATEWDRYAPTIMGRGSGTGGPLIPPHPNLKRRLSVRETARIQTFPDKFKFFGSHSAGYRQIGNAVPVLMAYNIAKIFKSPE